ncbi:helix-turn-helix domain-containing protein [Gluconacetobacter tumulisoli]|uniref:Helix-turn-helix domain-containing protein n=1 Tax=Gluconacetobacter tumulisoli TaxID=1286189 RepID=A0A7W4PJP1_9PROT|nr:helix-turn-helix domain-containing protein [Gluconacetobacter tumulisoli]MBB2200557.1 helix-turn-helix domain-containing protein [Gluconacetobacter tumulisoli]
MQYAVVLQPGQIWTPTGRGSPSRVVVDVLRDGVLYRDPGEGPGSPPSRVSQGGFRQWVRQAKARLQGIDPEAGRKASPSAELGKRIRILRKIAGLSQQQLADGLGLSRSAIAFWETGREGGAQKHLAELARILGVDAEALLTGMADEKIEAVLSPDEHDLVMLYRRLDPVRKINAQKWIERQTRIAAGAGRPGGAG